MSRKLDFKLSLPLLPGKVVSPLPFYQFKAEARMMTVQPNETRCEICDKKTRKTLFRKAVIPIYICSEKCLTRLFRHKKAIQKALVERDYWID